MIKCPRREREGADLGDWTVSPPATVEQRGEDGQAPRAGEGAGRGLETALSPKIHFIGKVRVRMM